MCVCDVQESHPISFEVGVSGCWNQGPSAPILEMKPLRGRLDLGSPMEVAALGRGSRGLECHRSPHPYLHLPLSDVSQNTRKHLRAGMVTLISRRAVGAREEAQPRASQTWSGSREHSFQ